MYLMCIETESFKSFAFNVLFPEWFLMLNIQTGNLIILSQFIFFVCFQNNSDSFRNKLAMINLSEEPKHIFEEDVIVNASGTHCCSCYSLWSSIFAKCNIELLNENRTAKLLFDSMKLTLSHSVYINKWKWYM